MFFETTGAERPSAINPGTSYFVNIHNRQASTARLQEVVGPPRLVRLSTRHIIHISIDL